MHANIVAAMVVDTGELTDAGLNLGVEGKNTVITCNGGRRKCERHGLEQGLEVSLSPRRSIMSWAYWGLASSPHSDKNGAICSEAVKLQSQDKQPR